MIEKLNIFKKITVEPCTFLYVLAFCLQMPAEQYFFYIKVCDERFPDGITCFSLWNTSYAEQELKVQGDLAVLSFQASLWAQIPPLFLTMIYGIISDKYKYGRKLMMLVPLLGAMGESSTYLAMALRPDTPTQLYFLGKAFIGFSGSWPTFFMAMLSYITCITTEKERTTRIGIANGAWVVAVALGFFVSGVILEATSFVFMFAFALGVHCLALLYLITCVHEDHKSMEGKNKSVQMEDVNENQTENEKLNSEKTTDENEEKSAIDKLGLIVKSFLGKRPRNGRAHLLIMLPMVFFILFGHVPFYSLIYLYTKKQPLSWSSSLFGYYMGASHVGKAFGMMVLLPLLKKFKVKDTYLLMASLGSTAVCGVLLAWADKTWWIFLAGMLMFFTDCMYPCSRAIVSYLLEPYEVGRVFAVIGSIQGASEMAATAFFNNLYAKTLNTLWPGFSFILGSIFILIPLGMTIWLHIDMMKRGSFDAIEEKENSPTGENSEPNIIYKKRSSDRPDNDGPDASEKMLKA